MPFKSVLTLIHGLVEIKQKVIDASVVFQGSRIYVLHRSCVRHECLQVSAFIVIVCETGRGRSVLTVVLYETYSEEDSTKIPDTGRSVLIVVLYETYSEEDNTKIPDTGRSVLIVVLYETYSEEDNTNPPPPSPQKNE